MMLEVTTPTPRTLIILAATLVAYQNVVTVITGGELFSSGLLAVTIAAILVAIMIGWSLRSNLTLAELGITWHRAARGAAIGLSLGTAVASAALVLLRSGLFVDGPVEYSRLAGMTVGDVIVLALIWMPLATVLPEELSFRGVLLAMLRRRFPDGLAAVLSAMAFALWHGLIVVHTVGQTTLASSPSSRAIGVIGAFAAIALGGWLFAQLRIRSGNLATSVCCHWAFNTTILVGLYALQH